MTFFRLRSPAWVSAPFSADDHLTIQWNIHRAEFIGRLVRLEGFAPIVVHSMIPGVFASGPLDDDEHAHAVGIACDLSLVRLVGSHSNGYFYELLTDRGERTRGMRLEWKEWQSTPQWEKRIRSGTWKDYESTARRWRLHAEWARMKEPPA